MPKTTVFFLTEKNTEIFSSINRENIEISGIENFKREKNADFSIEIYANAFRGTSCYLCTPGRKEAENYKVIVKNGKTTLENNNFLKIYCNEVFVHVFNGVIICS